MRHSLLGSFFLLTSVLCAAPVLGTTAPKVTLKLEAPETGVPRGGEVPIDAVAHIAPGWHINAHRPNESYLIPTQLDIVLPQGVTTGEIHYPPPQKRTFAFAPGKELLVYEGKLGLVTALYVPDAFPADSLTVEAVLLRYQACNDTTCLRPATAHVMLALPVVALAVGADGVGRGTAAVTGDGGIGETAFHRWLNQRGLVFTLLAVALLGLGLNLTPCVYPLISVTIAYFGGQSRGRSQVALLAVLYVLGIALSFSALGLMAALSGELFGAALQEPAVILFIAAVLVVLALGSFGLYQFQPPAALLRWTGGAGQGAVGALFMGLTMGIVAAPCVGPIVIGLLIFVGSRQDPGLGFLLFFFLALGMGAPYVILAFAAGSIRRLPRSGEWLQWTERLFGCMLISLAAYFVAPLCPPPLDSWLLPAVISLSGVYLGFLEASGQSIRFFPIMKRAVGVAVLVFAVWLVRPGGTPLDAIGWEPIEVWAGNGRDGREPVLIDFAAEWCIPCRKMDRTTYVDPDVVREAGRFRMVKADITDENDDTSALIDEYAVRGVPTIILFLPYGDEAERFVGYVGPDRLLEAMRAIQ